ncbi:MAG: amidohydrolase [Angelakisella sp.]|jgi:predicted amidohydrolase YtcJ|nr:amidohydrolase [Angelakisella sp.]
MDLILYNAALDPQHKQAAVAIRDGIIAAVGGPELLQEPGPDTTLLDLQGLPLLPGLTDSHLHLAETGRSMEVVDLSPARSPQEMGQLLRDFIREQQLPPGRLVLGWGWNQDHFPSRAFPTLEELDAMAPGHPLVLTRVCQHIALANSAAMALAGIDPSTPDPVGGEIGRGPGGRLTGVFREFAVPLLPQPPITPEDVRRWIQKAAGRAAALGLTAVHTDDLCNLPGLSWGEVLDLYLQLDREGKLPIRVVEQCLFLTVDELEAFFARGFYPGWSQGNFTIGPLKIIADGSLGARTALLSQPYHDLPQAGKGIASIPREDLEALVLTAHRHGMGAVIHAIGDGALDLSLNAIQAARDAFPEIRETPCHGIVHCQITRPDQLRRIREMGVQVLAQPVFLEYDLHMADLRVGEELGRSCYAWRTMVDSGIPFSAGSDSPIESMDPFGNLYCAVTRKDYQGRPDGGWHPGECLTLTQALEAATAGGAFAGGLAGRCGRIAPGYWADFTVPDRDIFAIPPEELLHTRAAMTIVGGTVAASKKEL